jgi:hypothetical protein
LFSERGNIPQSNYYPSNGVQIYGIQGREDQQTMNAKKAGMKAVSAPSWIKGFL